MRLLLPFLLACSGDPEPAETGDTGDSGETVQSTTDFDCEPVNDPVCSEDFAFCGNVKIPTDYTGTPRMMAVALYETVPPLGPPNATLAEIEGPALTAGTCFPVVIQPMLETGTYYLWVNLYMEGGGSFIPQNDTDYTGQSPEPLVLDSSVKTFEPIALELASGWPEL